MLREALVNDLPPDNVALGHLEAAAPKLPKEKHQRAAARQASWLDPATWQRLSPAAAFRTWLVGLAGWSAVSSGRPGAGDGPRRMAERLWNIPLAEWSADVGVLQLLVECASVWVSPTLSWNLIYPLVDLRSLAFRWLRPPGERARLSQNRPLEMLLHVSGWVLSLLVTRLQWNAGIARRRHCRRHMACLPTPVAHALAVGGGYRARQAISEWLLGQFLVWAGAVPPLAAAVYALVAMQPTYIGFIARTSARGGRQPAAWGPPRARAWQHFADILGGRQRSVNKFEAFSRSAPGPLACFIVSHGSMPAMAGLEKRMLKALHPPANSRASPRPRLASLSGRWRSRSRPGSWAPSTSPRLRPPPRSGPITRRPARGHRVR